MSLPTGERERPPMGSLAASKIVASFWPANRISDFLPLKAFPRQFLVEWTREPRLPFQGECLPGFQMTEKISGAYALAAGALEAGISLVTSYPGAPTTAVVEHILELTTSEQVQVEWTSNEKVALEIAFGASLVGKRSLVCMKSVGLNIALDPLMVFNLSGCNAGLVLLVGDDPGGWGSQNEQDSRGLALAAEVPLLEPTSASDAWGVMREAFRLSEEMSLPILVRFIRALAIAETDAKNLESQEDFQIQRQPFYQRDPIRWVVLPINVVSRHLELRRRMDIVRSRFEISPFNSVEGDGSYGVMAAGFAYSKLMKTLASDLPHELGILRLTTFNPLPQDLIHAFLQGKEMVLILEESAPLLERAVRGIAQGAEINLPIYGRDTGHVNWAGELFSPQIADALNCFLPDLDLSTEGEDSRPRPSRDPLCEGCPYIPVFEALNEVLAELGGRDEFVVVGDPGCMVRGQLRPYEIMDVKHSLGSSVGVASGIAGGLHERGEKKRVIALCGDSGFLHSGLGGLVDAARMKVPLLVMILDNGLTALSGGQPHPGSIVDARGDPQRAVDLVGMVHNTGVGEVWVVDLDRGEDIRSAIERGMEYQGTGVVVVRGRCPQWFSKD
jgi:indolepyruvate ferredoxin oxidoreductase alpha subunit